MPDLITNRQLLWKVGWLNIDLWRCLCSKTVYHKRVSHSCWNSKYRGDRVHISERKGYWLNSNTRIKHLFEPTMFTFPLSIYAICIEWLLYGSQTRSPLGLVLTLVYTEIYISRVNERKRFVNISCIYLSLPSSPGSSKVSVCVNYNLVMYLKNKCRKYT